MKVKTEILKWLFLLCLVIMFGCSKTNDGSYVEPITSYERLAGKWKLKSIVEVDELAKVQQLATFQIDLTSKFNFNTMILTLSVDTANGHKPTAFTVEGDAPEIFATNGFWDMDIPFAKTDGSAPLLYVYSDQAKTNLVDMFQVINVPGSDKSLQLTLSRVASGITFLSYQMIFMPSK